MNHSDVHLNIGAGGYKSCICMCNECYGRKGDCLCEECNCRDEPSSFPLHPSYYRDDPKPESHPCKVCGKEVQRKSSRGRWPSKCESCINEA